MKLPWPLIKALAEHFEGKITLIYGMPSTGKTSLALSLLYFILIRGGLGIIVYSGSRLITMRLREMFNDKDIKLLGKKVEIIVPKDFNEQLTSLIRICSEKRDIKVLVIDSISDFYQLDIVSKRDINSLLKLNFILGILSKFSKLRNLAVIMTCHAKWRKSGEIPIGNKVMKFYLDNIIHMIREDKSGLIKVERLDGIEFDIQYRYVIEKEGIKIVG